jgi:hypothetical protein
MVDVAVLPARTALVNVDLQDLFVENALKGRVILAQQRATLDVIDGLSGQVITIDDAARKIAAGVEASRGAT